MLPHVMKPCVTHAEGQSKIIFGCYAIEKYEGDEEEAFLDSFEEDDDAKKRQKQDNECK